MMKRAALLMVLLLVSGWLLRGWLYRQLVTYHSVGPRPTYAATDARLLNYLRAGAGDGTGPDVEPIIRRALALTAAQLRFTAGRNAVDPNRLMATGTAHCVGYAAFFATTCNVLLARQGLADRWVARPQVGQLYVLGTNVHRYVSTPFFKDHDFVTIENRTTGETFAVDPTVSDYLGIDFVAYRR